MRNEINQPYGMTQNGQPRHALSFGSSLGRGLRRVAVARARAVDVSLAYGALASVVLLAAEFGVGVGQLLVQAADRAARFAPGTACR